MRVLFTPYPAKTHGYNIVPLAWALQTAGHDVVVATHPAGRDSIVNAGLPAIAVGERIDMLGMMKQDSMLAGLNFDISETRPEKLTHEYLHDLFTWYSTVLLQNVTTDSMVDDLVDFARGWRPDLVIWDPLNFAGSVAAQACGAANGRMLFGLDQMARMRLAFLESSGSGPDPLAEWLGAKLRRHGREFSEEAVVGQWTIDPMPPGMRFPLEHAYVPVRYLPYNGPAEVPEWLRKPVKRPRVCLTLGISGREMFGADGLSIGDLFAALSSMDIEVVATLTAEQMAEVDEVPDNVRVADFVPLNALLPTCSAIIHHGGALTSGTAVSLGVPQLIVHVPLWDRASIASHLAARGAGLALDATQLTPGRLRELVGKLLAEESFSRNVGQLRREMMASPTPNDVVAVLEGLTSRHQTG